jgi:hypothetical protein
VKEFSFAFGDEILPRFAAAFVATVSSATALWLSSSRLLENLITYLIILFR